MARSRYADLYRAGSQRPKMTLSLRDEPTDIITAIKLLAQAMVIVGAIYWLIYKRLLVPSPGPFWAG